MRVCEHDAHAQDSGAFAWRGHELGLAHGRCAHVLNQGGEEVDILDKDVSILHAHDGRALELAILDVHPQLQQSQRAGISSAL